MARKKVDEGLENDVTSTEKKVDVATEKENSIMAGKSIYAGIMTVKAGLRVPKNKYNDFGNYKYRSAEGILEAVKPLLCENGLDVFCTDDLVCVNGASYIKATAFVVDIMTGDTVSCVGWAKEPLQKKGADPSQITGACSSYARKYALCGLFAIDDNKDADTNEYRIEQEARAKRCKDDDVMINNTATQGNDNMRKNVINQIINKARNKGLDDSIVSKMIKFVGFSSSNDMSVNQLCDFTNDFDSILESMNNSK